MCAGRGRKKIDNNNGKPGRSFNTKSTTALNTEIIIDCNL